MENTPKSRRSLLPILAGLLAVALVGVAVGFATGYFQVRPEVSALEVRRDEGVEKLFPGAESVHAFRFRGGLPKCWAQVDRPGGSESFAVDAKPAAVQGRAPRTPPSDVEGVIALVGPAEKGGTYTLHLVVSKLEFPEGRRPIGAAPSAAYSAKPTPGATPPGEARRAEVLFVTLLKSPELQSGQDVALVDGSVGPREGPSTRIRLWLRFYTPDELANAEAVPGAGQ